MSGPALSHHSQRENTLASPLQCSPVSQNSPTAGSFGHRASYPSYELHPQSLPYQGESHMYTANSPTLPVSPVQSPNSLQRLQDQNQFCQHPLRLAPIPTLNPAFSFQPPFHNNQLQTPTSAACWSPPAQGSSSGGFPDHEQNSSKKKRKSTKGFPRQHLTANAKFSLKYKNINPSTSSSSLTSSSSGPSRKKPKQSVVVNEDAIHFPVHRNVSSVDIPETTREHLNKMIYPTIETKKYSTSAIDPERTYLTVFEYMVNDHWIIWDYETGFVHLTGIWKAALSVEDSTPPTPSHLKADIVKLLESTPKEYQAYIKRIRGGFLKIQGTWLPFKLCKILARRFCYYIRFALIPIFGPEFPDYCLKPSDRGFGELKLDDLANFEEDALPAPAPAPLASSTSAESVSPARSPNVGAASPQKSQFKNATSSEQQKGGLVKEQVPVMGTFMPPVNKQPNKSAVANDSPSDPSPAAGKSSSDVSYVFAPPRAHHKHSGSTSSDSSSVLSNYPVTPSPTEHTFSDQPPPPPQPDQTAAHFPGKTSYSDLLDIMNASKCLQSLSRESNLAPLNSALSSQSPRVYIHEAENKNHSDDDAATENESDDDNESTIAGIEFKATAASAHAAENRTSGINSILMAAELNKAAPPALVVSKKLSASSAAPRPSMRISDLTA
ncbi:uncharacterized protein LODBEIA_P01470 [Lodderomyces beijingensis]|uniref:HTH APSES-type domain-containing protein n=1 Tax=Lodderomyces beijingensis TaxID=1775926 RepID=A0ABP0ZCL7_9ASCO